MFEYRRHLEVLEESIVKAIRKVLHSGELVLGFETIAFEREFATYVGTKHCIGVQSGTVAIELALMSLNIGYGDEVITVANTCSPTISAIERTGAQAILIDVNDSDLLINPTLIEPAITNKTKAVVVVHLWGQSVDLEAVHHVTKKHNLYLVEDCAQAHGTYFDTNHVGGFGQIGCFSFYPTKNLGAYGDAGAVVTNDSEIAEKIRQLRIYGYSTHNTSELKGINGRIGELQSAILRVKLPYLDSWLKRRREIADIYHAQIQNPHIMLPTIYPNRINSYHQFVIRCQNRQDVINKLNLANIKYGIHYETPIHKMPAYQDPIYKRHSLKISEQAATQILSIPIHDAMTDNEVKKVIEIINR